MKTLAWMLSLCGILAVLSGCHVAPKSGSTLFSVDFKQGETLRYKLISDRQTMLDFDPGRKISKGGDSVQHMNDRLEATVAYKTVSVGADGVAVVDATFEKVNVTRNSGIGAGSSSKDAVTYLEGKTVRFSVSPTGAITDTTELDKMLSELVKQAFGGKGQENGIKDPDMIMDFVALQWFMWDAISSIERPASGVSVGDSWKSKVMSPLPWPGRPVRDTVYTLTAVNATPADHVAVIASKYTLSKENAPKQWPMPYKAGSFRMRSTFGFLTDYKILSCDGNDIEHYSVDNGRIIDHVQNYTLKATAGMPFALGSGDNSPQPTLNFIQKLSVELIK